MENEQKIQWQDKEEGIDQASSPFLIEMLEKYLQENPMSTVVDLEDEQIQINRFGVLSTDKSKIYYLELDSRIDPAPELLKTVLASEFQTDKKLKKL